MLEVDIFNGVRSPRIISVRCQIDDRKEYGRSEATTNHKPCEPSIRIRSRYLVTKHRFMHGKSFSVSRLRISAGRRNNSCRA